MLFKVYSMPRLFLGEGDRLSSRASLTLDYVKVPSKVCREGSKFLGKAKRAFSVRWYSLARLLCSFTFGDWKQFYAAMKGSL